MVIDKEKQKDLRQFGTFVTIPFVLGGAPVVGWFIGSLLDKIGDTSPFFMYVFIVLGFVAGVREVYRIIRRFGDGA